MRHPLAANQILASPVQSIPIHTITRHHLVLIKGFGGMWAQERKRQRRALTWSCRQPYEKATKPRPKLRILSLGPSILLMRPRRHRSKSFLLLSSLSKQGQPYYPPRLRITYAVPK